MNFDYKEYITLFFFFQPSKAVWLKDYASLRNSSVFGVMKGTYKEASCCTVAASILVTKGFGKLKKVSFVFGVVLSHLQQCQVFPFFC